jgi:hypothetical protein
MDELDELDEFQDQLMDECVAFIYFKEYEGQRGIGVEKICISKLPAGSRWCRFDIEEQLHYWQHPDIVAEYDEDHSDLIGNRTI